MKTCQYLCCITLLPSHSRCQAMFVHRFHSILLLAAHWHCQGSAHTPLALSISAHKPKLQLKLLFAA
jgi:hypothetical protein